METLVPFLLTSLVWRNP